MKNQLLLFSLPFLCCFFSEKSYSQTPITNANFNQAIATCLSTNPVDGMCTSSQYGAMPNWDVSNVTTMYEAFYDRFDFNADISSWDVSTVTNMEGMFRSTPFNQDIGNWDVNNVTNMELMFSNTSFNQDLSSWDVSNATDMRAMFFNGSSFNQDISSWDVSNVIDMSHMFRSTAFNQDIGSWDVSNVIDMRAMFFNGSSFNQDISSWDVSNVTDMSTMFSNTSFNQDISSWDVSNVTDMSTMFSNTSFNQDIRSWDVSNVTDMRSMFSNTSFNQDISSWDVSNVTLMNLMFSDASFNQDISSWDVSNVTEMNRMFRSTPFNGDISSWDVSNVNDMELMFSKTSFNQDISSWSVSNVTNMSGMFSDTSFNGDISSWDVSNVIDMRSMFFGAAFNQAISSWDVSSVTDMSSMFFSAVFNQDISSWDVSNVIDMRSMFRVTSFNQDISSWDVSNVTDMSSMFNRANAFNIDISSWDVSNVTNMIEMFLLTTFNQDLGNWDVSNVTDMDGMFNNSNLSAENYDAILNSWSTLTLQPSVELGAFGVNYCSGEQARQMIIDDFGWNIIDAGLDCSSIDSIDPIAVCQDITVQLDNNGTASINGVNIDGGSTDNVGIVSYTAFPNTFNCSDIGANMVTLTVTDAIGNTDSCSAIVTIEDTINPNVIGQNVEGDLLGTGSVTIPVSSVDIGSTDNCSIANVTLTPDTFTSIGTYASVLEGTDASGNTDTANITITIIDSIDGTDPIAVCQDITVQLDNNGAVVITGNDIDGGSTDNIGIVSYTAMPNTFNCSDIGTRTVTLTVVDAAGNSDSCSAIITIEDIITPNVIGQNAQGDLLGTGSVTIPISSVDNGSADNCSIVNLTLTPDTFTSVGTFNAVLEGTDASGNRDDVSVVITIIDDILNTLEQEFTNFLMYPNPANSTITIDGGENTLLKRLEIFDITGKRIISNEIEQSTQKLILDISRLETSVYFVSITDVNGRQVMRKLIKE